MSDCYFMKFKKQLTVPKPETSFMIILFSAASYHQITATYK
jgi:hypothetical protein